MKTALNGVYTEAKVFANKHSPKVLNWDFFPVSVEGKNQYDTNSGDVFNRSQHAQSRLEKKRAVGGRLEYD